MVSGTYFYFQWQPLERKHTKSKDNYTFGKVYIQVKFKHTYVQVYIQVKFKKELYYCKKKKKANKFFTSMGPFFGKISIISESK